MARDIVNYVICSGCTRLLLCSKDHSFSTAGSTTISISSMSGDAMSLTSGVMLRMTRLDGTLHTCRINSTYKIWDIIWSWAMEASWSLTYKMSFIMTSLNSDTQVRAGNHGLLLHLLQQPLYKHPRKLNLYF